MTTKHPDTEPREFETEAERAFAHEQVGYHAGLKNRQIQMIAIGGAIGTGLFLGAGGRLASAGPSLFVAYAICGVFAYFILRALGELVLHRPSSGSFVSYAREFYGEKFAFAVGWMYFFSWTTTAIADVTAIALYAHFWSTFTSIPQWVIALAALVVILSANLVSVKVFGEFEFWFALIKVLALVAFLVVGTIFLVTSRDLHSEAGIVSPGTGLWADNGGFFPTGVLTAALVMQAVIFAYAAIELVGTAAGETANPRKVIPRAINAVIFRMLVFYVGSVLLLALLLPYTAYSADQSPFVTFFGAIGDGSLGATAGSVMNFVVLTAALSSLNAGMYSTGRILRSMAEAGSAPQFTARMSKSGVPYGGILLTVGLTLIGIVLNLVVPEEAFNIVLNATALTIVSTWSTIVLCQMRYRQFVKDGRAEPPTYRLPGAPFTAWLTLAFLAAVVLAILMDYPTGTWTAIVFLGVAVPALVIGWHVLRARIEQIAAQRQGYTGPLPVRAETPAMTSQLDHAADSAERQPDKGEDDS